VVVVLVIALGLAALPAYIALAACPTTLTLTLNEDPHLLVDSNNPATGPHVTTAYATITNTGLVNTAYDVYMYVGNGVTPGTFNAGSDGNRLAMLSGPSYATRYIGNLAPGESKTVYWMLTYPLTYGQTYPMTIWASNAAGCSVSASHTYTTQSTISAEADKILGTVTMNPPSGIVSVGNILTVTVTGFNLGTVGTGGDTWFQPVGNADFNPAAFRLVRAEVYIHSIASQCGYGSMPYINRLYFPGIKNCYSYNPTDYAKYYFVALQEATTTMKVYQEAASGSQEKYSGDYGVAAATLTATSRGSAVTLAKSVSPLSGGANTTFTWTITYTNNSDYPVGDPGSGNGLVLIDEAVPTNTTYVATSATCSGLSCLKYYSTDNGATWNQTEPSNATSVNKLKWYITQTIPAHGSGTVSLQSKVNSGVSGTPLICNSASAKIDDGASVGADGVCANGGVDLELSKVLGPTTPCEDSPVTYTVTVANPSSLGATNVQVTDLVPTGLTYFSSAPSPGTSYNSLTGLWTVGNLNAGNSATLLLTATVNSGTGGQIIRNTATITHADQPDPVLINNSAYIEIFVRSTPVAVAYSDTPVCVGDTIQLYGGPSDMSYYWTGPNGFTSTVQRPTISSATLGMTGTYYLTVTSPDGCSDTVSIYVTVQYCATPPDTPINVSPGNATCVSLPVTLTASAFSDPGGSNEWQAAARWQIRASTGGYSYPVFDSGTDTVDLNHITIPAGILSDSSSYYWHVMYQGNLGAWSQYSSETCFYTKPVAIAYSDSPVCEGKTIQLYGGPSGMNYSWTGPLGFTSDLQRPTIGSATLAMTGTYTLTVIDVNGCSDTASTYVTVQTCATPPVAPFNISPVDATCIDLPVTLTASAFSDPGGSNEWQAAAHWQIRVGGGGYSDPVFDNVTGPVTSITIPAGILSDATCYFWHVRYQGDLGAWSEYSGETLFCTKPVATASSESPVCVGETIQLYGGHSGLSYSWTGPNGFISFLQRPTIPNAATSNTGTYYLTVTAENGCSDTASTTVSVQPCATPPYRPTNISPSTGTCVGLPVTLTASAFSDPGSGEYQAAAHWQIRASMGGYSYPVFDSVTAALTSITVPAGILSYASGYYWHVRYQGDLGAWSEYSSETFFCTNPVAAASSSPHPYVGGTIQLYGGPDGMDSYSWTGPNEFSSGLQNPIIPHATLAMAGTYTLTVTTVNGCTGVADISVTVDPYGPSGPVGWETQPINKVRVLLPWFALVAAIVAGVSLLVLRRRRV
jgi:uncharacterized repeat protein (TIGR01451 family)